MVATPTFPLPSIVNAETEEVAKVVGEEVAIYRAFPMARKFQALSVAFPWRASCGVVVVAIVNFAFTEGVEVPMPTRPLED